MLFKSVTASTRQDKRKTLAEHDVRYLCTEGGRVMHWISHAEQTRVFAWASIGRNALWTMRAYLSSRRSVRIR